MIKNRKMSIYLDVKSTQRKGTKLTTLIFAPEGSNQIISIGAHFHDQDFLSDYIIYDKNMLISDTNINSIFDFRSEMENTFIDISGDLNKDTLIVSSEGPNNNVSTYVFGCLLPVGISVTDGHNNVITFSYGDIKEVYVEFDKHEPPTKILEWQENPNTGQMDYFDHINTQYLLDNDIGDPGLTDNLYQPRDQFMVMFKDEISASLAKQAQQNVIHIHDRKPNI